MNTLEIISYNVNGIRSATTKGLIDWIKSTNFDVYLFQEIKANELDIPAELFHEIGYETYWFSAQKKGYSGVGIAVKSPHKAVVKGMDIPRFDAEGRLIRMDIGDITIVNSYFPSGSSGDERQSVKMEYLADFYTYIHDLRKEKSKIIVAGDYNICHQAIDIHDPIGNKNSSGFLPEEREWMTKYFNSGFIDTFRYFHPEQKAEYSWWSFRANARNNNKGWRIDYLAATKELEPQLLEAKIFMDVKHSDHCPVYLKLKQ
ncbi:MAG TPA: exodeoxyribonuclease III [Chitinophagales bacterium]|jgi:exodeoxyribonuclease-3|nr:exodeoxyribonuclease III [Chitinophagales bacterium]